MAAVPPGIFFSIYFYGRFLSRYGANRALTVTSLFSAGLMAGAYFLIVLGYPIATAITYVFREVYIVLILEQYWSFLNSSLNPQQASGINGPFCGIASLGSIAGGSLVKHLAEPLGSEALLLLAAASLIPAAGCAAIAYILAGEPQPSELEKGGRQGHTGIRLFLRSQYLVFILLLILTTQVVSAVLELQFNGLVEESIADRDARTAFFGGFYGQWLGISAALLQFIGAPILLRILPLRLIHLCIPVIHFIACGVLTISPSLGSGVAAFLLFKAFDYSIFRAAKEIFYIPLSFDARYRAKQVIDSLGYRSAKGGCALIIALIGLILSVRNGTIPGMAFSITAMVMAAIWAGIASKLTHFYQKLEYHR